MEFGLKKSRDLQTFGTKKTFLKSFGNKHNGIKTAVMPHNFEKEQKSALEK